MAQHRRPDPYEFRIGGENCSLIVRLSHYEMPGVTSGEDADWVSGEVEMTAGTEGVFKARRGVSVFAPDLVAFLQESQVLLESLTGEANLGHLEGEFGCRIRLRAGRGHLSAFVREHVGARLAVDQAPTDQSYLQATVAQLRDALAALPPRGNPPVE